MHILRRTNTQRQDVRIRVADRPDRVELRRKVDLAHHVHRRAALLHVHRHLDVVVVAVQQIALRGAAALDAATVHQLADGLTLLDALAGGQRVGEDGGGLLEGEWNEVVVGVRGKLRVSEEELWGEGDLT